jgi:hypothetical protein
LGFENIGKNKTKNRNTTIKYTIAAKSLYAKDFSHFVVKQQFYVSHFLFVLGCRLSVFNHHLRWLLATTWLPAKAGPAAHTHLFFNK